MKTLYFDCFSGISGDMAVAALLDAFGEEEYLFENLKALDLQGCEVEISKIEKSGFTATDFNVKVTKPAHVHRGLGDIISIIDNSGITQGAKDTAKNIFGLLANAEAKVHNTTANKIHFHEVGAADSIIDIVSFAVLLDKIKPDKVISSPLNEGRGFVSCEHGIIPVPSPATAEIVRAAGGILNITDNEGEMVTPTGAAIICAVAEGFEEKCNLKVTSVGYGAGKRDYERPNLLRVFYGEASENGAVTVIETNIDDCSPEILAYAQAKLLDTGALDAWFEPVFMKKGRPSYKLCALCEKGDAEKFAGVIFAETTAIGLRYYNADRITMDRKPAEVVTKYGTVKVKRCSYGKIEKYHPEYESVKEAAEKTGAALADVYDEIKRILK